MKAYKVLTESQRSTGAIKLRYFVNKKTYPYIKGSQLFVFKRLKDARLFGNGQYHVIWQCEVPSLRKLKTMIYYPPMIEEIERFWGRDMLVGQTETPEGTYVTPWVKLIKPV